LHAAFIAEWRRADFTFAQAEFDGLRLTRRGKRNKNGNGNRKDFAGHDALLYVLIIISTLAAG
jgi:hypothetical protein